MTDESMACTHSVTRSQRSATAKMDMESLSWLAGEGGSYILPERSADPRPMSVPNDQRLIRHRTWARPAAPLSSV